MFSIGEENSVRGKGTKEGRNLHAMHHQMAQDWPETLSRSAQSHQKAPPQGSIFGTNSLIINKLLAHHGISAIPCRAPQKGN
jgi:hypothetical protein